MGLLWPEQGVRCRDLGVPGVDSVLGGLAAGGAHGDFVVEVDFVAHVAVGPHVLDVDVRVGVGDVVLSLGCDSLVGDEGAVSVEAGEEASEGE